MSRLMLSVFLIIVLHAGVARAQVSYALEASPIISLHDKSLALQDVYAGAVATAMERAKIPAAASKDSARIVIEVQYAFAYSNGIAKGHVEQFLKEAYKYDDKNIIERLRNEPTYILVEHWRFWDMKHNVLVGYWHNATYPNLGNASTDLKSQLQLDLTDSTATKSSLVKYLVEEGGRKSGSETSIADPTAPIKVTLENDDTITIAINKARKYFRPKKPYSTNKVALNSDFGGIPVYWWAMWEHESSVIEVLQEAGWDISRPKVTNVPVIYVQWRRTRGSSIYFQTNEYSYTVEVELTAKARGPGRTIYSVKAEASSPSSVQFGGVRSETHEKVRKVLKDRNVERDLIAKLNSTTSID